MLAVDTNETELAGPDALTAKMVMAYDPNTDTYSWSKIFVDVSDLDVHFAAGGERVLVNWIQWGAGNTIRRARNLGPQTCGNFHSDDESRRELHNRSGKRLGRPVSDISAQEETQLMNFNGLISIHRHYS